MDFSTSLGTDSIGIFLKSCLLFMDNFLGSIVPDPDSDDGYDLGVNRFLRSTIVDEDGAFSVNITNLPDYTTTSGVIIQVHDMIETNIMLNEVKIYGLDSFDHFDPLNAIGRYTLGNSFSWQTLSAEFNITLVMQPSKGSDFLKVVNGSNVEVRELITVSVASHGIDVGFHFLFGFDHQKLGKIKLGAFLDTSLLLSCLLSSAYSTEVTGLSATVRDMDPPNLNGFISPGIDKMVSKAMDAAYIMYEPTILRAMPNFFELTVRDIVNEVILILRDNDNYGDLICSKPPYQNRTLNFVRLFTGMEPYGTFMRDMVIFFREAVQAINPTTGDLYINDGISKFTSQLSGVPGTLMFPRLFGFSSNFKIGTLSGIFELQLSDLEIKNIHSFGQPIQVLGHPGDSLVSNKFVVGSGGRPLNVHFLLTVVFSNQGEFQHRYQYSYTE